MDDANQSELAQIERARLRLLVAADVEGAAAFHADDFQLITPSGWALSKDEYLEQVGSGDINYTRWTAGDILVRSYGVSAVLRYPAEMEMLGSVSRLWHTDLYERRDGRWQVVWSQATLIRE